ncbi:MAG: outer membrane beta-barrel protein [Candidatus Cryptobacteroides sp.]
MFLSLKFQSGGYFNQSKKIKIEDESNKNLSMDGFFIDINYNFKIINEFGISTGLSYSFFVGNLSNTTEYKTSVLEHSLEVPVLVNYGYTFNDKIRAFVYAGLEFSLALAGTVKSKLPGKKETKTKIYSSESDMRRFNLFITGGLGLEVFKMVQLKLGYSFGCISKASTFSMYDSRLKLGVAYLF